MPQLTPTCAHVLNAFSNESLYMFNTYVHVQCILHVYFCFTWTYSHNPPLCIVCMPLDHYNHAATIVMLAKEIFCRLLWLLG